MTIPTEVVIAFISAILLLLGGILRLAINGDLTNPSKVVPRADYEALRAINAAYPGAIEMVAGSVQKLATMVEHVAKNGSRDR